MSVITIDYDRLNSLSKTAADSASRMDDYINNLSNKVMSKYGSISGGASNKTQNSSYYVNQKISKIKEKRVQYSAFSSSLQSLGNQAREIDLDVANRIKASKDEFIEKNDYIKTDWWTEIKNWFVDLKNSCPLFNAICQLIENIYTDLSSIWDFLKYWYKCGGGKEIVGIVLAVAGAIAAIVIFVCSFPVSTFFAAMAAIGAFISAVSAVVNVVTSIKAKKAKDNGDPAWAKIYSDQDTVQDYLRETNFNSKFMNSFSYRLADTIDVVEAVCAITALSESAVKVGSAFKEMKLSAMKGKVKFGTRLKQYLFNSNTGLKDNAGNPLKWRSVIQKRTNARALSLLNGNKANTLTQWQKNARSFRKIAANVISGAKISQHILDNTIGGKKEFSGLTKDLTGILSKKLYSTDLLMKVHNFSTKNLPNVVNCIKQFNVDLNSFVTAVPDSIGVAFR